MKILFYILLLTFIAPKNNLAQDYCQFETIKRQDGTIIKHGIALPVAGNNNMEIGIAATTNSQDFFISMTIRFSEKSMKITGDLNIRFESDEQISFPLLNSQLANIGNSNVAQAIFLVTQDQLIVLKKNAIKNLSIRMEDGIIYSFKCEMNNSILKEQFNCLQ